MAGEFVDAPAPVFVDAPAPKATAPPRPTARHFTTPFEDPKRKPAFDTSKGDAALDAQGRAVGQGITNTANAVGGTLGLFNRPGDAVAAWTVAPNTKDIVPNAWRALSGQTPPGELAANRDKLHQMFGNNPAMNTLMDIGLDPLTPLSMPLSKGRTAMGVLMDAAEGAGFSGAVKAGGALAKLPGGSKATDLIAKAHDVLGVHSAAKRELARLHGPQWLDKYAEYRARLMQMGGQSPEESLEAQLQKHLLEVAPEHRSAYERALVRGGEGLPFSSQISPHRPPQPTIETGSPSQIGLGLDTPKRPPSTVQARPKTIPEVVDAPVHGPATIDTNEHAISPRASSKLVRQVGFGRPKMTPAQTKKFYDSLAQKKRALAAQNFVTNPHLPEATNLGLGETGEQESLFQRPAGTVPPVERKPTMGYSPERVQSAIGDVAERLGGLTEEDRKIFGLLKPKYEAHGGKGALLDALSVPSDILTAGMFIQPAGHMANISGLGAMTDPLAVAAALGHGTIDNAKKLTGAVTRGRIGGGETEEQIAARHAGAQRGGAISTHKNERINPLDTGLGAAGEGASKIPIVGKALALVPKAVRGLYRASGDILWKFDDEVKARRFEHLVSDGMDPQRAGLRVGGELVDYENKSPAARALRPIAPFATWRTKAPLAVARNAVENPGKVAALNRIVPAAMGGSQGQDPDSGKPYISSLPGSEFNKATSSIGGAANYVTGTGGAVPRLGLDMAGALFALSRNFPDTKRGRAQAKQLRTFATYGQEPSTFLLNELPGLSNILQMSPAGMFNKGQTPSDLNDLLNLIRVRPGTP